MMKQGPFMLVALALALAAVPAMGQTLVGNGVIGTEVDRTNGGLKDDVLAGYVTTDLVVNTETDLLTAELLVILETGSFYQDAVGSNGPPMAAFFAVFPKLEFDTYVHIGGALESVAGCSPDLSALHGVDCTGETGAIMDETQINITWFNTAPGDIGDVPVARVSMTDDATGRWSFQAIRGGEGGDTPSNLYADFPIIGGRFVIPEPSALAMAGLAGLLIIARRRP